MDDLKTVHDTMKARYPDVPYVFFGHSMGSFLARTYLIRYPDDCDAAIISGTAQQNPLMVKGGLWLAGWQVKKLGARGDGQMLNDIAFGSYNNKIKFRYTDFDWLSRDEENVRKYIDDPLCGFVGKCGLYRDMMEGIQFVSSKENAAKMILMIQVVQVVRIVQIVVYDLVSTAVCARVLHADKRRILRRAFQR